MITFAEADTLCDRICDFLVKQGGPYHYVTRRLQENVIVCLASNQFVIEIDGGDIQFFAAYFRIRPEDVEGMAEHIRPVDVYTGSIMYVVECGNKAGKRGMTEICKRLRVKGSGMKGIFWHRQAKADKLHYFPSQKGKEA